MKVLRQRVEVNTVRYGADVKIKCAIPHEECSRVAHLPSLGREPVGG